MSLPPTIDSRTNLPAIGVGMNLGTMQPGPEDLTAMVERWRAAVEAHAESLSKRDKVIFYAEHWPLGLRDYCLYAKDRRQLSKELRQNGHITSVMDNAGLRGFLNLHADEDFTPDYRGWLTYLRCLNPKVSEAMETLHRPSSLPEHCRREHTLIVAPVNWGKSELMKTLVYHYAQHDPSAAVIVLDPGGDMVKQIARWPELVKSERAILIEPDLQDGKCVGFNALDGTGLAEADRSIIAGFWASQIGALTKEVSAPMERMARHCVHVLLTLPGGANFFDLMQLLGIRKDEMSARQKQLLRHGQTYSNPLIAEFFKSEFLSSYSETTRAGLRGRIDHILSVPYAQAMFCGKASFDLERAIEDRKFILVNLARFGQSGSTVVGRLLVALIGALVRRRNVQSHGERTPTHLFVDEVSTMVSEDLLRNLKELRKFGLYSTLAQQVEGDGFTREYRQILFRLTACKFLGSRTGDVGGILDTKETLTELHHGQFWVQWPTIAGVDCLNVRSDLVNDNHAVEEGEWQRYEDALVSRYYVDATDWLEPVANDEYEEEEGIALTPHETRQRSSFPVPPPPDGRPERVPAPTVSRPSKRRAARPVE